MHITILGASRFGVATAQHLIDEGHEVVLIDRDRARLDELARRTRLRDGLRRRHSPLDAAGRLWRRLRRPRRADKRGRRQHPRRGRGPCRRLRPGDPADRAAGTSHRRRGTRPRRCDHAA